MQTTKTSPRLIRVAVAACLALTLLAALASPALGDDGEAKLAPPKAYYLSLGDSQAFGLQFDRLFEMLDAGTYTPDAFNTGYTDVLAARMHQLRPDQQTVNLSCPGESTDTMINGVCSFTLPEPDGPGLTLHTSYAGPQLDAAVSFLRSHLHQVNPITVSIGGIDAADIIAETCNFDAACIKRSGLRDSFGRGLDRILGASAPPLPTPRSSSSRSTTHSQSASQGLKGCGSAITPRCRKTRRATTVRASSTSPRSPTGPRSAS
jgi:hypothetical protein